MKSEWVKVTLKEGYYTTAKTDVHTWHADLPEESGGTDAAPTPEEIVMGTLGSCMAQTAKLYAARKEWQIDEIEIDLSFKRFSGKQYEAYDGNAPFVHEIKEKIRVEGPLDDEQKRRIIEIMGKCPIRRLIANPAFFVDAQPESV